MTADTLQDVWLLRRSRRATHINSECNGICESATADALPESCQPRTREEPGS
jgi:hypothetical protein